MWGSLSLGSIRDAATKLKVCVSSSQCPRVRSLNHHASLISVSLLESSFGVVPQEHVWCDHSSLDSTCRQYAAGCPVKEHHLASQGVHRLRSVGLGIPDLGWDLSTCTVPTPDYCMPTLGEQASEKAARGAMALVHSSPGASL